MGKVVELRMKSPDGSRGGGILITAIITCKFIIRNSMNKLPNAVLTSWNKIR